MGTHHQSQKGFTLLELSIVLVIVAFIIGSILVGQDLIKAAEMRATIGQVEKYNTSVNTFRNKFGGIPGDLMQTSAGSFGMLQITAAPLTGEGDGNGLVEGGSAGGTGGAGETLAFWRHLSDANLVDGAFGNSGNSAIVAGTGLLTADVTNVKQSMPGSKTFPVQYFIVYSASGFNYFQLIPVQQITAATGAYSFGTAGLTPIQAFSMDTKLDDGIAGSGSVIARSITSVNASASVSATSTVNSCTIGSGSATDTYNVALTTGGMDASCSLRFRFN